METFEIIKYSEAHFTTWNNFVAKSKNATFLFHRDFMGYHKDRFEDTSLMVCKNQKLVAIFPANKVDYTAYSHQGLTYGGLILLENIKFDTVLKAFREALSYLKNIGIKTLVLKQMPSIYLKQPSDEISYLMFILKAELIRRDSLSVIQLDDKIKVSNNRFEGVKKAEKLQLTIKEEHTFDAFWNEILIENLQKKHNAKPVHSLEEITLLKKRFPNNIKQFNVYNNNKIVAGTTVFVTDTVAHSQYISGDEDKNELGSLDFLHLHLINNVFKDKVYFDFGTSNENQGKHINKGLQFWKEGFGARTVAQDFYKIKTENFINLDEVFV